MGVVSGNIRYGKVICPKCGLDDTSDKVVYYGGDFAYCKKCKSTFSIVLLTNSNGTKHDEREFVKCPDCGCKAYKIEGKEIYCCEQCKATFKIEAGDLINCGFAAYQIEGNTVYLCQQCKSSFRNEVGKYIKCPKCGNGQFVEDDVEQAALKKANNSGYSAANNKKDLNHKKSYTGITVATILAIILLVSVIAVHFNDSNSTSDHSESTTNKNATQYSNTIAAPTENEQSNRETQSTASDEPDNMGAFVISQNFVKDYIVSPSTADFPIEATNIKRIGNKFMVYSYLDAQNSYGAKIREKYMCLLIFNGGEWSHQANWTLEALQIGDDIAYIDKSKTEKEIANDIDYLRTH